MLVDINLLPRKKPRNITTPLVYGISLILVLFVIISLAILSYLVNQDVTKAENDLYALQQLREEKEEALHSPHSSSSAQRLQHAVDWAEDYSVEMVPILEELVRLLPSRGYMRSFTYAETGSLNITIQFDEYPNAAYYLYHLNKSALFEKVNLLSISTSIVEDGAENDVLPRYAAKYELSFDRSVIKDLMKAEEEGEETAEEAGGEVQ